MVDRSKAATLVLSLGGDQLLLGKHAKAIARFHEAIRLDPNCAEAYAWLGRAYRETGRLDEAERAFREAIRLKPGFALAHYNLGLVLATRGRSSEALEQYAILQEISPVRAERLLWVIKRRGKDIEPPPVANLESPETGGGTEMNQFDPMEGQDESQERDLDPRLVDTVADVFETEPAAPEPETAASGEDSESKDAAAVRAKDRAGPQIAEQRALTEVERWKQATTSDPRDPEAYVQLGQAYVKVKEFEKAAEAFEKAIANRVDFAGTHPESVRESVQICLSLGLCYERLGRFRDAARIYEQALDIDPDNASICFRLGLVMLVLNNRRKAADCYRDLVKLDPFNAEVLLKRLLRVFHK